MSGEGSPYSIKLLKPGTPGCGPVHQIEVAEPDSIKSGDTIATFCEMSDNHFDSKHHDTELEDRHLKRARQLNAGILFNGDLFDAMQGRGDPRGQKTALREEFLVESYSDALVNMATERYGPYADLILLAGDGNHETKFRKFYETDLTSRWIERMRYEHGCQMVNAGYESYLRFNFTVRGGHFSVWQYRFHGAGGSAPVTKGAIDAYRLSAEHPDADLIKFGHKHESGLWPQSRHRVNRYAKRTERSCFVYQVPGYQKNTGFLVEKGNKPRPRGCAWLEFIWDGTDRLVRPQVRLDVT